MGSGGLTELTCVQVSDRGKWHITATPTATTTVCGQRVPVGATRRALDLVDSGDRCRSDECREARAKAKGLLL